MQSLTFQNFFTRRVDNKKSYGSSFNQFLIYLYKSNRKINRFENKNLIKFLSIHLYDLIFFYSRYF